MNLPTQCPLHIGKVSQKYLKEFLELLPAQDLNNQGRKLQNGVRVSFLNVQFWRQGEITHGPSQLVLSFLYLTPLPNALYNLTVS